MLDEAKDNAELSQERSNQCKRHFEDIRKILGTQVSFHALPSPRGHQAWNTDRGDKCIHSKIVIE